DPDHAPPQRRPRDRGEPITVAHRGTDGSVAFVTGDGERSGGGGLLARALVLTEGRTAPLFALLWHVPGSGGGRGGIASAAPRGARRSQVRQFISSPRATLPVVGGGTVTVTTTRYAGDQAQGVLAFQADPTQCAGSGVTSAAVNGVVGVGQVQ